jgi:hypothetical protein
VSSRGTFWDMALSRSRALTIRGEQLANILLLACCYQEASMGRERLADDQR